MTHVLPELGFSADALSPAISAETLEYHHGKHHRAYVDKLNAAIAGGELEGLSLEELVRRSEGDVFNNAAQHYNHSFYWSCMGASSREPEGALAQAITRDFGSFGAFREAFDGEATTQFGSGWTWLVQEPDGKLSVESTSNADTPLQAADRTPLLTCDVWEHAYYIDHRNARPDYVSAWWGVVNWEFVASNLRG